MMLKTGFLVLAVAGLTGCAVYPAAPYGAVYEPAPVYVSPPPVFIGGSVFYEHRRGYSRPHGPPRPHLHAPQRPHQHAPRPGPRPSQRPHR